MQLGEASALIQGQIWITDRYEQYVVGPRDLDAEREALVTIMTRPRRVRTGSFSASATGTCPRKRQFQFLGEQKNWKTPGKTFKIFHNGDYVHLRYQAAGLVGGWLKQAEVIYTYEPLRLVGTADGLTVEDDLIELKSINSRGFKDVMTFGPDPKHIDQINAYLFLSGLDQCWLLYENKDNQDSKEFRVVRNEKYIASIVESAQEVNQATDERRLLPMLPECEVREGRFKQCEYSGTCPTATWPIPEQSSSVTI